MQQPGMPPEPDTMAGTPRRVGVEIEFGGLTADQAARVVRDCFGGTVIRTDLYCWQIAGTSLGDFETKLDTRHVEKGGSELQRLVEDANGELGIGVRKVIGRLAEGVVPTEIVSPPLPMAEIGKMDILSGKLREAGATDSSDNPLLAFGLHLNPEVRAASAACILPVLQAYLFLSPWLRDEIGIDLSRRILPFIDPFPAAYRSLLLNIAYNPPLDHLIADYLEHNPTRNRELDLLPLFAHIDEKAVRTVVDDQRIKPRPTYHYRLPEARLESADWSVAAEWNRWVAVERLAADKTAMQHVLTLKQPPEKPDEIAALVLKMTGTRPLTPR